MSVNVASALSCEICRRHVAIFNDRLKEHENLGGLDAARADSGPKIAINRFVLIPRGL